MTWDVFSADFGDFVSTLQSEAVAAVEPGSEINISWKRRHDMQWTM